MKMCNSLPVSLSRLLCNMKITTACVFYSNYDATNVLVKSSMRRLVPFIRLGYVASYNEKSRYVCFESDFSGIEHVIFTLQITLIETKGCQCVLRRSHVYISFPPSYKVAAILAMEWRYWVLVFSQRCIVEKVIEDWSEAFDGSIPAVVRSCVWQLPWIRSGVACVMNTQRGNAYRETLLRVGGWWGFLVHRYERFV
jgi:hypothetical protein